MNDYKNYKMKFTDRTQYESAYGETDIIALWEAIYKIGKPPLSLIEKLAKKFEIHPISLYIILELIWKKDDQMLYDVLEMLT